MCDVGEENPSLGTNAFETEAYYNEAGYEEDEGAPESGATGASASSSAKVIASMLSAVLASQKSPVVPQLTATQKTHFVSVDIPYQWLAGGKANSEPPVVQLSPAAIKELERKTGLELANTGIFMRSVELSQMSTSAKHDVALVISGHDSKNPAAVMPGITRHDGFVYHAKTPAGISWAATGDVLPVLYHNPSNPTIVELHGDIDFAKEKAALQPVVDMHGVVEPYASVDSRSAFGQLCISRADLVADDGQRFHMHPEPSSMMHVNVEKALALIKLHQTTRLAAITMTRLGDLKFKLVRPDLDADKASVFSAVGAAGLADPVATTHDKTMQRASYVLRLQLVESAKAKTPKSAGSS